MQQSLGLDRNHVGNSNNPSIEAWPQIADSFPSSLSSTCYTNNNPNSEYVNASTNSVPCNQRISGKQQKTAFPESKHEFDERKGRPEEDETDKLDFQGVGRSPWLRVLSAVIQNQNPFSVWN